MVVCNTIGKEVISTKVIYLTTIFDQKRLDVGELTSNAGESTSFVGELPRWPNDRFSFF